MARFNLWEIILAWLPNTDGTPPPYKHRCIYLCDSPKRPGAYFLIGITSNPERWSDRYSVDLPYADPPAGDPITHLVKRSFCQANWFGHLVDDEVGEVVGRIPEDLHAPIRQAIARAVQDIKAARGANRQQ